MKDKLTLSTDRKSASEGEYIEIKWTCDACPDSLYLALDSGFEKYSFAVADNGTTRIPMKCSKGKTTITLNALIGNKKVSKSVEVKIRNARSAKSIKSHGICKIRPWKEKLQARWYVFRAQWKYWWISRKKWQKALLIALLILWFGMLISSFVNNRSERQSAPTEVQTAYLIR